MCCMGWGDEMLQKVEFFPQQPRFGDDGNVKVQYSSLYMVRTHGTTVNAMLGGAMYIVYTEVHERYLLFALRLA